MDSPQQHPPADELVRAAAKLARLELQPDERVRLAREFADILDAFRSLAAVPLGDDAPPGPRDVPAGALREDEARGEPVDPEPLLARAPERDGDFFRVPKTVGGDAS